MVPMMKTDDYNDQSVDNSKLSPEAVTCDKVRNKAITTEKLNDRAVTTEKIAHNSVSRAELALDVRTSIDKKADAEQVNKSLYDLEKKIGERFVVEGDVINLPDEEDITTEIKNNKGVLKFKDREANATNFQSKGYIILRKNLVEIGGVVKNILTQDMVNKENTIYRINYDYDILSNISLKSGSSIEFDTVKLLHFNNNAALHFTDVSRLNCINKHLLYVLNNSMHNNIVFSIGYYLIESSNDTWIYSSPDTQELIKINKGLSIIYFDSITRIYITARNINVCIYNLEEVNYESNYNIKEHFKLDSNDIPYSIKTLHYKHTNNINEYKMKNVVYKSDVLTIFDNTVAVIDVVKYGIPNDGTDITEELINLINNITVKHYTLYFRAGRYTISKPIDVNSAYIIGDNINNIEKNDLKGFWNKLGKIDQSDNGNNFTVINYTGEANTTLFTGVGTNHISNIMLYSSSYNIITTFGGSTPTKEEASMTENTIIENVSCLSGFKDINNIAILGFSGIGIYNIKYAIIKNVFATNVNTVMSVNQDCNISNIRAVCCKTIASIKSLNQISNVRGDSIIGPCFIVSEYGSVISNIIIDYNIEPVIYMNSNANITIFVNINRNSTNTWDNSIDSLNNSVTTKDCFIYVPKTSKNVSICFYGSIRNSRPVDINSTTQNIYPNLLGVDGTCYCVTLLSYFLGGVNDSTMPSIKRFIQISETGKIETLQFSSNIFANNIYAKNVNHNTSLSNHGTTQQRPNLNSLDEGFEYYDTTLKKKILWNGTAWVNLDGSGL